MMTSPRTQHAATLRSWTGAHPTPVITWLS